MTSCMSATQAGESLSTSRSMANTPARWSRGRRSRSSFADGAGRLAQLPGTSFYQRIREKFGHLASEFPGRGRRLSKVGPMERKWWTLVLSSIATFMLLLDITVVNVALPDIQRDLDASLSSLQWVVDAYSLMLAAFLLTAGSLGDRLGRGRVFSLGLGLFTFASFLCGIAGTPPCSTWRAACRGSAARRCSPPPSP